MKTQDMTSRRGVLKLLSGTAIASGIASGLMATAGRAQSASVATVGDSAITIDFDLGLNSRIIARQNGKAVTLTDFAPSETVTLADGKGIDRFAFADKSQKAVNDIHGRG
ncbi:MAG TPA: alpha-galactosidase, partial [Asticcacaulis sp.]|nr:alpha-galactosidase [Asticcacaulis sp.]